MPYPIYITYYTFGHISLHFDRKCHDFDMRRNISHAILTVINKIKWQTGKNEKITEYITTSMGFDSVTLVPCCDKKDLDLLVSILKCLLDIKLTKKDVEEIKRKNTLEEIFSFISILALVN
ncbi:MAG: hypothetical protein QW445_07450 [Candidatus Bathyarchaeia archaeon]